MTDSLTPREALDRALPRSQGEAVDAIMRELNDLGFVIVPKQPTAAMYAAGYRAFRECPDKESDFMEPIYEALLEAADGETVPPSKEG